MPAKKHQAAEPQPRRAVQQRQPKSRGGAEHEYVHRDLKALQERYDELCRTLYEIQSVAHLGTWDWDFRTGREWWSEEQYCLFGYKPGEIEPSHEAFLNLVHPDDREVVEKLTRDAIGNPGSWNLEFRLIRRDGAMRWMRSRGRVYCDKNKRPVRMAGTEWDITEYKLAQEALRDSAATARALLNAPTDSVVLLDRQAIILDINETAAKRLGGTVDRLIGACMYDLMDPEAVERRKQWGLEAFESGKPVRREDQRAGLWFDTVYYPVFDSSGQVTKLAIVARDITVRKRAEEQMLVANERLQYLLSSTSAVIYTAKPSGDLGATFISGNVVQMVGYAPGEFIRDSSFWYDHVHPEDRAVVSEEVLRVFGEEFHAYEYRFKHRDGRYIWVRDEMRLVRDHNGDPLEIIGFWVDVTNRKLAEEEKEKLRGQLLQAQKMESVGRLAGGLAHDFNNMLSVILGHAELAMMHCTPSEPIHADLKEIEKAAQRSADLTRQLLTFARKQTVLPKVLDLNGTVASMLKMLQRLIGENIDLVWMPGAGVWPVKIDLSQIDQLLVNLCLNARDAITGVGKVTIETQNTTFDEAYCAVHPGLACGEYVTLIVSDNGCGIDKEGIDHLFEPFFTTKELGRGTGLGLATVYGIVRQNEGFIDVLSEPDKGATFKIYLPRSAGKSVEPAAERTAETPKSHGETVLLVEDDAELLNVGRRTLERLGYTVLTAGTPGEALRQAEAHAAEIRLLITDVVMPEMNGRALAKLIRDIKPGLKCLFTSGYTADIVAHHGALDEGMYFLQKPFSLKELASKVRQALECE